MLGFRTDLVLPSFIIHFSMRAGSIEILVEKIQFIGEQVLTEYRIPGQICRNNCPPYLCASAKKGRLCTERIPAEN